jgi:hypothetical protein
MRNEDKISRNQIEALIKRIKETTKEYVEEPEHSYRFQAKVFNIFAEVLDYDNETIDYIIENGFDENIIDSFVDEWESD